MNGGYLCGCGVWVMPGVAHVCGQFQPFPQPFPGAPQPMAPACRAPWMAPPTLEDIRKVIREELMSFWYKSKPASADQPSPDSGVSNVDEVAK